MFKKREKDAKFREMEIDLNRAKVIIDRLYDRVSTLESFINTENIKDGIDGSKDRDYCWYKPHDISGETILDKLSAQRRNFPYD